MTTIVNLLLVYREKSAAIGTLIKVNGAGTVSYHHLPLPTN
ncbi:hypothetical protein [Listeria monocytogenes]